ncbi:DUF3572 family protein [Sphingomonas quercus]|uniref:DUF3572 domain-containing protein n=1 Tax=Sphingomonas quercus TaxID=2842451 RepID=A0ABS6BJ12_9SPHN|nr:DUF3572 family protein [Sphingomonas quercus]MBU3077214.1 DUF3572 domain-containing protein [Sphingomonas quercus]
MPDGQESHALSALIWILSEASRARRLLDLTGLTPAELREGVDDPAVLAAVLAFLEAHEPDLVACAEALDVRPQTLIAARRSLEDK